MCKEILPCFLAKAVSGVTLSVFTALEFDVGGP
jgi:hypothetical protein